MARGLVDRLKDGVERSTSMMSFIGIIALIGLSISLQELRWPIYNFSELLDSTIAVFEKMHDSAYLHQKAKESIPALGLILVTIFWYTRYKKAVLNEINLIDSSFIASQRPISWIGLNGTKIIMPIGYVITGTYCLLILAATNIRIYCFVALLLHLSDLIGNSLVLTNLSQAFAKFQVPSGRESEVIAKIREILRAYYFDNYTLLRVCILTFITAMCLFLSSYINSQSKQGFTDAIYVIVAANILIGELVIKRWRMRRDYAIEQVYLEEERIRVTP